MNLLMIQDLLQSQTGKVCINYKFFTPKDLVTKLSDICADRLKEIEHEPNNCQMLATGMHIRFTLDYAKTCNSDTEALGMCLAMESFLLAIAPKKPWNAFETYWYKVDELIFQCNQLLKRATV